MSRPETHRDQPHERCCGNCQFSKLVAYKHDLLCFHGDSIEVQGQTGYPIVADYIVMNGEEVGMLDGDEYGKVWASRITDYNDVCDEWKKVN